MFQTILKVEDIFNTKLNDLEENSKKITKEYLTTLSNTSKRKSMI